jgi:predicted NBD/HSP70 family sugar kinase
VPSIGIDLGGTKIAGISLAATGAVLAQHRVATPQGDYAGTVAAVIELIRGLEEALPQTPERIPPPVGIGTPGAVSTATGAMKNCNSTCLNGRHLREDIAAGLGRAVRIANDADCLALSECTDGAARGAATVFAAILGTGVGGGVVANGSLLRGPNAIAGEWGHNVLPGLDDAFENERRACYCGRYNCIETYLSGPGFSRSYALLSGRDLSPAQIADRAARGDAIAATALQRYQQQLAYALAQVINILDPDVVVLGGGLSNLESLYDHVPRFWRQHIFSDTVATPLLPARFGAASGVRGAARLWQLDRY